MTTIPSAMVLAFGIHDLFTSFAKLIKRYNKMGATFLWNLTIGVWIATAYHVIVQIVLLDFSLNNPKTTNIRILNQSLYIVNMIICILLVCLIIFRIQSIFGTKHSFSLSLIMFGMMVVFLNGLTNMFGLVLFNRYSNDTSFNNIHFKMVAKIYIDL